MNYLNFKNKMEQNKLKNTIEFLQDLMNKDSNIISIQDMENIIIVGLLDKSKTLLPFNINGFDIIVEEREITQAL